MGCVVHSLASQVQTHFCCHNAQVVFGGIQQVYEVVSRVLSSPGSLMAKQDRGHKLLGSAEAWKQVRLFAESSLLIW